MKCIEDKLIETEMELLEHNCHNNGLSSLGTKEELIARLLVVEEYKLKKLDNEKSLKMGLSGIGSGQGN